MLALTLTPPWGTLIAILAKRFETRGWALPARAVGEPLAIHQAKGLADLRTEAALVELCAQWPFRQALAEAGITDAAQLPRGCIVAVVTPRRVWAFDGAGGRMRDVASGQLRVYPDTIETAFGDYGRGRFGFELDDVRRLATPVPCRGMQKLWTVPAEAERQIEAQL